MTPTRRLRGFTLVELLAVIALLALLLGLVFPAVQIARETGRRTECANKLRTLALAFNCYAATNERYPPMAMSWDHAAYQERCGGWPGSWYDDHGWYSQMGPYIEQLRWHDSIVFEKSFSDAGNRSARMAKHSIYACPNDGIKENEWHIDVWARVRCNYVVNAGNTNFGQATWAGVRFLGAPFGPVRSPGPDGVSDGLSNTLLMSEVITTTETPGWGGPIADITTSLGGNTFNGWLPPNSPVPDTSPRLCPQPKNYNGIPGCTLYTADAKLGQFAARSKHVDGVTVVRCDGSTGFVSDTVDLLGVWRPLTTARGGRAGETPPAE